MRRSGRHTAVALVAACGIALGGCASGGAPVADETYDPLEGMNRSVFGFNKALDENILGPISDGYVAVTPEPAREAIFNFFDSIGSNCPTIWGSSRFGGPENRNFTLWSPSFSALSTLP